MRNLIYILAILLIVSCKQRTNTDSETKISPDSLKSEIDSTTSIDTTNTIIKIDVDSFLFEPFNLHEFKLKKNGSLSGGIHFKDYHYKPDIQGVGYSFFMFEPKSANYIKDGKEIRHSKIGYIGTNKKRIKCFEDGLEIKTFQPKDKFKDKYLNPNEILIELIAKYNDFDLPELAFVGLDSATIIKKLGKETFYKNHCLVYSKDNKALILKLKNKKVDWLRYVVLKENLDFETNIDELYMIH